ncbi:MAG: 3-ketoacyl-ACP reductase [Spirochaetaceae bacterium]|jgi:NAD(P)-dependent dehydrogenase (short-subunit alcohol dehydrogenase family)|nr:3-ketoacyl-ACP reductase [Spirochaetaceae bacterium]
MKKTAIVTGGRRGIGRAAAIRLGAEGFNVVVNGASDADGGGFADAPGTYFYVQADVGTSAGRERLVRETLNRFGAVHLLVNNAGVAPKTRTDLLDMTEESFDYVMNVNAKATMFLTQLVARQMLQQEPAGKKRGTVINISSCSAAVSSVNRGEYCVSKAGISMLTLLYADRLAREGIFVHEIRPGVIATDMTCAVREKYDALIEAGMFPIPRWGAPEDVASAVALLAGDALLYTTGNYIDVDGGFHIRRL